MLYIYKRDADQQFIKTTCKFALHQFNKKVFFTFIHSISTSANACNSELYCIAMYINPVISRSGTGSQCYLQSEKFEKNAKFLGKFY